MLVEGVVACQLIAVAVVDAVAASCKRGSWYCWVSERVKVVGAAAVAVVAACTSLAKVACLVEQG